MLFMVYPIQESQSLINSTCQIYNMGVMLQPTYKNYVLSVLSQPQSQGKHQQVKSQVQFYRKHLLPGQLQVPCFSLSSQKNILPEQIYSQIYQKPQKLSVLTYNVWFQGHNDKNRYSCILKILDDSGADVICLQQVNQQFMGLLHSQAKNCRNLKKYYIPMMKMHWYDTLILSRYPCRFYKKQFQSSTMGRCLLTAVLEFAEGTSKKLSLGVNCVHLQSLNSADERMNQLKAIKQINEELDVTLIAGDFNFSDGWRQNKAVEQYRDVWREGKRHFSKYANEEMKNTGFTMPCNGQFPVWRPDHIIYRHRWEKLEECRDEIEIIGDFTIPPYEHDSFECIVKDKQVRTPSDHFGLIARISL